MGEQKGDKDEFADSSRTSLNCATAGPMHAVHSSSPQTQCSYTQMSETDGTARVVWRPWL